MADVLVATSLPDYVSTHTDELLVKAQLGAKTLDYIDIMTNVKYKSGLNYLDSEVVFGDGKECGFNAQGSDTFTQRTIEVTPLVVNKEWCQRDFLKTYANHLNLVAAGRETLPFEERIVQANLDAIRAQLDTVIWQGLEDPSIAGFVDICGTEEGVIDVSVAKGSTSTQLIDAVYASIPAAVLEKGDVVIFVNPTIFRNYVAEHNASCCANQPVWDAAGGELVYLGDSRVKVVAVGGLSGVNAAIAGNRLNFVYGTDVEDSDSIFKLWYSDDADMFRFKVLFNAGVQIKFPDEVVYGVISAS